jgi:hypothetical protein
VVARDGTEFLEEAVTRLPALERNGRLQAAIGASGPDWLAFCRRRITTLTGQTARPACA